MEEFEKNYSSVEFEAQVWKLWDESKCFHAKVDRTKKKFSVVLPPPNITGRLHMGHALNIALQDIIVRFKRMQGFETLWVPGADHASIATEAKIVEKLKEQGTTKNELGREKFLDMAWKWKNQFETMIFEQIMRLGASCDFERSRFTMDDGCKKAVFEFFSRLFNEGLIYSGERVINWCFKCKTSISDIEVEHKQQDGNFWYLKYYFADSTDLFGGRNFLEVATTRPETIFGDVAVAVNPNDKRYVGLVGKQVVVPLVGRKISIIADSYVDMEFGTGAVKITPAHDFNDFEVGQRHGLESVCVFDKNGRLNEKAGEFAGLSIESARDKVVSSLEQRGLVAKVEPHVHNVGHCYRCGRVVEPVISKQWFVKMEGLAGPAIEAVESGAVEFVPKHFEKTYLNWLRSVKDWCISRQLWWGHQIPAWHCKGCGEVIVGVEGPDVCKKCGSEDFFQDPDTLDTWFSSALWPFETLGWPNESAEDYGYFYPTDVLVTGYDIIFFWVVRMIVAGLKSTGKVPFRRVLIHGIVRDSSGRKMSKSLGNGVDPLEIIEKFGADALRFVLASNLNAGSDIRWNEEKLLASRNFANKLWNASRFIFLNMKKFDVLVANELSQNLELEDLWLLSKLNSLIEQVSQNIESFEISIASQKLYDFVWDVFCSWFVELAKIRLVDGGQNAKNALMILTYVHGIILKLLHPFMPFITEKINLLMNGADAQLLAVCSWPKPVHCSGLSFDDGLEFEKVVDVIKKIRNIRAELKFEKGKKAKIVVETKFVKLFEGCAKFFKNLAGASEVVVVQNFDGADLKNFVKLATDAARIFVDVSVDVQNERSRLLREKKACEDEIEFLQKKLANRQFVEKAPKSVVEKQNKSLQAATSRLKKLIQNLNELS